MMSLITVHISNAPCIFGNYSQDCLECKQTYEHWRQWNEGNCKLYHMIEKRLQNT